MSIQISLYETFQNHKAYLKDEKLKFNVLM